MYRSFTDRIFGGVCGGIAEPLPLINGWIVRLVFIVLTFVTLGAFGVLYLMLWLVVPQQSLIIRQRGGPLWMLLITVLTAAVLMGWWARINGYTLAPNGADLYYPVLGLLISILFFLRQIGRSA